MYSVLVKIQGVAPLLQHRYPVPELSEMVVGGKRQTGATDYTQEWRKYFYATPDGMLYQPASHLEGALSSAAAGFKITGRRGKTYKDLFRASVFVTPEALLHGITVPDALDTDADKPLYLDVRPVVVQHSRVVRLRPAFKAGWQLAFNLEVLDDQIAPELLNDVLTLAGRTVGIGDFRPKFGRFMIVKFEEQK